MVEGADLVEQAKEAKSFLNAAVAVMVAILATFMGVCNVKDGNVVQAMQQAQADSIDHWAWYQARKVRIDVMKGTILQLEVVGNAEATKRLPALRKKVAEETGKLDEAQKMAANDKKTYDAYNFHDDQFDLSESSLGIAISLFAVTALTQKRWLFFLALIPTIFGLIMGLAGLCNWSIHPDFLANLLGA